MSTTRMTIDHQRLLLVVSAVAVLLSGTVQSLSIGVNYGTLGDNLPPPTQVAAFLRDKTFITSVKLFDTNPDIIRAFANSPISVVVTVPNGLIPSLAKLPAASQWVASHVLPFYPATNITLIAVGNEILNTGDRSLIANLLPAMRTLHLALRKARLAHIRVSTPHSMAIMATAEPPSAGRFKAGYARGVLRPLLRFHRKTSTPFVVNPYPYFGYDPKMLGYALFRKNRGLRDPATGIRYTNMFEAHMDAVYSAMKSLGYGDVEIVVGETGWPSKGEPGQVGVSTRAAGSYNTHLIRHVNSGRGTPLMPHRRFQVYLFALFNENRKPGPIAERNWGLFYPNLSPVYDAGVMRAGRRGGGGGRIRSKPAGRGKSWCVAKRWASAAALQKNIDYVCSKGVDCRPIQAGGACFLPNDISSHASYAMNAYYQAAGRRDFNCHFAGTGVVTARNPSRGACRFA